MRIARFPRPPLTLLAIVLLGAVLAGPAASQSHLRVGIIKYKTEESVRSTYTPLVEYLATELALEPSIEILTGDDLAFRLAQGEFDIGIFTPFPYLDARLHSSELEVFASHVVNGNESYRGAILVRADSGIEDLGDLAGRHFQFVKPTSTSGFKYPVGIFREHGFDIEIPDELTIDDVVRGEFFEYDFSRGHPISLFNLLQEEVDGIAIDRAAFDDLNPVDQDLLEPLVEYGLPYHAYVFRPGMDAERRERIRQLMFAAHRDPDARDYFDNSLGIERWVPREDTDYNSLRRYLGMVRSRPTMAVQVHAEKSAQKTLDELGDVMAVVGQGLRAEIVKSSRFEQVEVGSPQVSHTLAVDIGRVGKVYHCQVSLDGGSPTTYRLAEPELASELPRLAVERALESLPLSAALLNADSRWFITYGTNDGLSLESYSFHLRTADGREVPLADAAIADISGVSTEFHPREGFARGARIIARSRIGMRPYQPASDPTAAERLATPPDWWSRIWEDPDNRWGVIGLLVALASVGIGSYFNRRRKRRFKTILNETLQLLTAFVGSQADIASKIIEQREKISQYLDRGYINENQYLILKDHISEVERVIEQLGADTAKPGPSGLDSAVRRATANGVVTEQELTDLVGRIDEPADA